MKIAKVDVFQKTYSMVGGKFVISGGKVATSQDSTIVRIETDDGLVGWGEQCVFSPSYLIAHGEGARAAIGLLAPAIIGMDPCTPELIFQKMETTMKGHHYAKAAIDIACWDLFGKATGMPLSDLLGGTHRKEIPLYAPISMGTPEEMKANCEKRFDEGYTRFQMKVGGDYVSDLARVKACMEVIATAEKIIFDANGNWSQHEAIRIVTALQGMNIYIEQPCATMEESARVRKHALQPFILDESLLTSSDILKAYEIDAMDAVMLKISRFGGITPIKKARDLCVLLGLGVSIEDSGGGDIVTAAMAHLSASTPDRSFVNGFFTGSMVHERLTEWGCRNSQGIGYLPAGPGLGISVDESLLGPALTTYT
ncbi:MAG: mandelate racemase/muconate lactonizing enzyme family protein [Actinobacteria bacterium]|nr:mandelate racemase/muconate lactonizing enzyme family protein [Actinomycetota bacterium]